MMNPDDPILVVGAGSIGERYIRNVWQLGFKNIVVLRQRNLPFRDIGEADVKVIYSWNEAEEIKPRAAIICTPTFLHMNNAMECVSRGIHVLIEKPLSHNLNGIEQLTLEAAHNHVWVQVGYMMRYYPLLIRVKEAMRAGTYGKLQYMNSYWGEYLPDWHPWEDYRESYAAKKQMGGGVALTLSHDLDVCNWMVGQLPVKWSKLYSNTPNLDVDVESAADFILAYPEGTIAHVHLNFFQKVKERWYQYVFDEAVLKIDFLKHELSISTKSKVEEIKLNPYDRNELFIAQIEDFLRNFDKPDPTINILESAKIIEICNS